MQEKSLWKRLLTLSLFVMLAACSSGDGGGDDLDIVEVKEIESTGNFSEDEFFNDVNDLDVAQEEAIVEKVEGLESEIDFESEGEANLEAAGGLAEEELVATEETVNLDGLEGGGLEGEEVIFVGEEKTQDALQLENEEDLFREDTTFVQEETSVAANIEQPVQATTEESLILDTTTVAENNNGPSASELLTEDVSIDVDYSTQTQQAQAQLEEISESDEKSAAELLGGDVSIDVDYGVSGNQQEVAVVPLRRGWVPVKKMKTTPYVRNGVLVNALYIVRQGDNLRRISDKIYGSGRNMDFTIVNPHLRPSRLRVGQKVYYNSPRRPQDRSRLLFYYEDMGMPHMTYSARKGENIRTLSEKLLGHHRSWMEVWATNLDIQSKWNLERAFQIRYWNGMASPPPQPAPSLAQNNQPEVKQAQIELESALEESEMEAESELALEEESISEEPEIAAAEMEEPELAVDPMEEEAAPKANIAAAVEEEPMPEEIIQSEKTKEEVAAAAPAAENLRSVAKQNGFPRRQKMGFFQDKMRLGIMGLALLLLGFVIFLVWKRRRDQKDVVEMESFDFGGDTVIDEEQAKTQIDI